ncbi:tRNA (adenosine(37)-N6)-dimethylallyltransferase MiaA [Spirulina sp. CS-785/01]|uniref:tRNA (adenosine(37)-N6)-dimethylallyltransferase MiaA n=1 Tax=Spirulina sp. CS-785/01 TaxID=3021716 RepID=UPI00232E6BB1|nr:tRNA (adenosine(37)-N6)-dimethylallyltransferase MiaA [Spirulina sp. CS-785/01]MDB9312198.1 tRNA (adenosine(37)-N6)-dimethylallyltransferase MiaA [Spirulina sp. CS-785/01]
MVLWPNVKKSRVNRLLEVNPLIVICGATATGKSGLALQLARRWGTSIISADSRQVYREFDIGTAKPTVEERQLVPHYWIDSCDPTETLTLADYQEQTQEYIQRLQAAGNLPLLVGGTGLYIKSITKGLKIPRVPPQGELRCQLSELGQSQLYAFLLQVDPVAAQKIHPNDQVRTLRALEVYYVTGVPISQQQGENPPSYPILQVGLTCSRAFLEKRIYQRTEKMLAQGLVAEVQYLCDQYGAELPLLNTLGYAEIKQYLGGEVSLEDAKTLIVQHTRQFAKRQETWFRAYPEIVWFNVEEGDYCDRILQDLDQTLFHIFPQ